MTLGNIVGEGSRLEQLKELLSILAETIDSKPGARDLAQLAKQYRETLKEIEELERSTDTDDEIGDILQQRAADGEPGAVRPNRAAV